MDYTLEQAAQALARAKRIADDTARRYVIAGLRAAEIFASAEIFSTILTGNERSVVIDLPAGSLVPSSFWRDGHFYDCPPAGGKWSAGPSADWRANRFHDCRVKALTTISAWLPHVVDELPHFGDAMVTVEVNAGGLSLDTATVSAFLSRTDHRALYERMVRDVGRKTRERTRDVDLMHARIVLSAVSEGDVRRFATDRAAVQALVGAHSGGNISAKSVGDFVTALQEEAYRLVQEWAETSAPIE